MKRIWRAWVQFLATDSSLSALLVMLIVVTLVLPPLTGGGASRNIVSDEFFSLLLISGIAAVWSESRLVFWILATVAIGALAARWLARFAPAEKFIIWNTGADMLALISFALVVLAEVVRPGTITSRRIQGAVAVYLLFGLVWAEAYKLVDLMNPGAFAGAGMSNPQAALWIYYSFVTLTTMGYGDITPVHPAARSLAAAEALTGQLYIAILISRLVALELATKQRE